MYCKTNEGWIRGVEVCKRHKKDEGWLEEMQKWILRAVLKNNHNYMDIVTGVL